MFKVGWSHNNNFQHSIWHLENNHASREHVNKQDMTIAEASNMKSRSLKQISTSVKLWEFYQHFI